MTDRQTIAIIARREISSRLRNKAFIIGSVITLVILAAVITLPAVLADDGTTSYDVAVVGTAPDGFTDGLDALARADDAVVSIDTGLDRPAAEAALRDGDIDAAVDGRSLVIYDGVPDRLQQWVVQSLAQASLVGELVDAGVPPDEATDVLRDGTSLAVTDLDDGGEDRDSALGIIAAVALFITVQLGGSGLLSSSIEEKTSRVVEVLLGAVSPRQLLTGKVLGALVVTMVQFTSYVAIGLGLSTALGTVDLPSGTFGTLVTAVVMVVVGFLLYATFFAVAGAMASGIEDAQSTVGPMMLFMMTGYMGVFIFVIPSPDSLAAQILGYLPVTAPFAVPSLYAVGSFGPIEVAIAAAGVIALSVVALRLAGRLYSAALLASGTLSWRAVLKAEPLEGSGRVR